MKNGTDIGVLGLAVMGKNLAMNIESRGYHVSIYNRAKEKTDILLSETVGRNFVGTFTLEDFVASLAKPRKIILMIQAGKPVDIVIEQLLPLLDQGDILIDGGNSYYQDTVRRNKYLEDKGIRYIGTGVSGGEEGALKGPAIMPGGQEDAYRLVEEILVAISAKVDGEPCCTYIGPDGAGHYVKMVHNGIEYADMQLICEAYHILKTATGMSADELADVFKKWDGGELDSYLIEITWIVLQKKDDLTGKPVVDIILDRAGQKGTGKWTSTSALDFGVPAATVAEAVFARCMSAIKTERVAASKILTDEGSTPDKVRDTMIQLGCATAENWKEALVEMVRRALYASKICAYAQGFALMAEASKENNWNLDLGAISMIFRGGCIIRAKFLQKIKDAYDNDKYIANLMLDPYFHASLNAYKQAWREVAAVASLSGIPVPAFTSALSYYDSYRSAVLPANLLQAQRDYFGAHTFERNDREGIFHIDWFGDAK